VSLTLYFLRHGQTSCSRDNMFCSSGMDPELTGAGQQMAEAFASAYRGTEWRAVYSSPLRRTVATARPLCEAIGAAPELRDGLKEIGYGRWEGLTVDDVNREFHDDYLKWSADPAWNAPSGGELAISIASRALQVVEEIRQRHAGGNVLVVSHKATIRIVLCSLLGIDAGRFRYRLGCPVGSVSVVEFANHGPLLHALANVAHLSEELRSLEGT